MTKVNPQRVTELMDEFVESHNENTIQILKEMEEE
jgi:hypothetical protein